MIEAAFVLPVFLFIILTLVLCMVHQYECHRVQIELHEQLLRQWDLSDKPVDVERQKTQTTSEIEGIVYQWLTTEKESRIYIYSPPAYIRLGEMVSFDQE